MSRPHLREQRRNRALEDAIVKTVAAFLNTEGGNASDRRRARPLTRGPRGGLRARQTAERANVAAEAGKNAADPADELRRRCRAYCHFALDHPYLYRLMFQTDLPQATIGNDPTATPGRRALNNLVAAVERCLEAGLAPPHEDPFRLASLIWTAEHGIMLARIARPSFPWPPLEPFVDEMVNRIMAFPPTNTSAS